MKLVELQAVLNSSSEDKLVSGLSKASLQILQEHGYFKENEDDLGFSDDELGHDEDIHEDSTQEAGQKNDDENHWEDQQEEDEEDDEKDSDNEGEEEEEEEDGLATDLSDDEDKNEDDKSYGVLSIKRQNIAIEDLSYQNSTRSVTGLLASYLDSSPQLAELSVLWDLEQRQASRKVAEKHTFFLSVILRCVRGSAKQSTVGLTLCRQLLHQRNAEIYTQLISSNQELASATLKLLISMVKLSSATAWEVIARFSLTMKPLLHLFAPSSSRSRPIAIALVSALMRCRDAAMTVRMLSTERILNAVFEGLSGDPARTTLSWLATLSKVIRNSRIPGKIKRRLLTKHRLEQLRRLLQLQEQEKGPSQSSLENFHERRRLVKSLLQQIIGGQPLRHPRLVNIVVRLLLALSANEDSLQGDLVIALLCTQRNLAGPFMQRFSHTWEIKSTFSALASLAFLGRLLHATPTPEAHSLLANEGFDSSVDAASSVVGEKILDSLLPAGLGKRELTKSILSPNPLLQQSGLNLMAHMIDRFHRFRNSFTAKGYIAGRKMNSVRLALVQRLPDLQAVLALKSRCTPAAPWSHQLLSLLFLVMRKYQEIAPEVVQAVRYDFSRLIGEDLCHMPTFVQWELVSLLAALQESGRCSQQLLPPDTQAWCSISGKSSPSGFTTLLALLCHTKDVRLYRLLESFLIKVISTQPGEGGGFSGEGKLAGTLLDVLDNDKEGPRQILEFALRLTAAHPYPFSLLALHLSSTRQSSTVVLPSPVIIALLLLISDCQNGELDEKIRKELQVFGLVLDPLKGRFSSNPAAIEYVHDVVRAIRGCENICSQTCLSACVEALLPSAAPASMASWQHEIRRIVIEEKEKEKEKEEDSKLWMLEEVMHKVSPKTFINEDADLFQKTLEMLLSSGKPGVACLASYLREFCQVDSIWDVLIIRGDNNKNQKASLKRKKAYVDKLLQGMISALPMDVLLDHSDLFMRNSTVSSAGSTTKLLLELLKKRIESLHVPEEAESTIKLLSSRILLSVKRHGAAASSSCGWLIELLTLICLRLNGRSQGVKGYFIDSLLDAFFAGETREQVPLHLWTGLSSMLRVLDVPYAGTFTEEDTVQRMLSWGAVQGSSSTHWNVSNQSLLIKSCISNDHASSLQKVVLPSLAEGGSINASGALSSDVRVDLCSVFLKAGGYLNGRSTIILRLLMIPTDDEGNSSLVPRLVQRKSDLVQTVWDSICVDLEEDEEEEMKRRQSLSLILLHCVQRSEICFADALCKVQAMVHKKDNESERSKIAFFAPAVAILASRPLSTEWATHLMDLLLEHLLFAPSQPSSLIGDPFTLDSWRVLALRRLLAARAPASEQTQVLTWIRNLRSIFDSPWKGNSLQIKIMQVLFQWMLQSHKDSILSENKDLVAKYVKFLCQELQRDFDRMDPAQRKILLENLEHLCSRYEVPSEGPEFKILLEMAASHLMWTPAVSGANRLLLLLSSSSPDGRSVKVIESIVRNIIMQRPAAAILENVMAEGPRTARMAVLRFLSALVSKLEKHSKMVVEYGRFLVAHLLPFYGASLSECDQCILHILWALTRQGFVLSASWFRLKSKREELEKAMKEGGVFSKTSWLEEWVDPERIFVSLERFALNRDVFPTQEIQEAIDDNEGTSSSTAVYDPAFLLPLVDGMLKHGELSLRGLVDSCLLSFCLISLASTMCNVRVCAYSCLQQIVELLNQGSRTDPDQFYRCLPNTISNGALSKAAKERPQYLLLLQIIKSSIKETTDAQQFSYVHALFLARAAIILCRPANDLYVSINSFLVHRQALDLQDVPLFFQHFYSSKPYHRREKLWVLRLMRDSLHSPQDVRLLARRHCFQLLLSFLDGAIHNCEGGPGPTTTGAGKSFSVADSAVISLVLQVLSVAAQVEEGARHLLLQANLLPWTHGSIATFLEYEAAARRSRAGKKAEKGFEGGVALRRRLHVLKEIFDLTTCSLKHVQTEEVVIHQGQVIVPVVLQLVKALRALQEKTQNSPILQNKQQMLFISIVRLLLSIQSICTSKKIRILTLSEMWDLVTTFREGGCSDEEEAQRGLLELALFAVHYQQDGEGQESRMISVLEWLTGVILQKHVVSQSLLERAAFLFLQVARSFPALPSKLLAFEAIWPRLPVSILGLPMLLPGALEEEEAEEMKARVVASWSMVALAYLSRACDTTPQQQHFIVELQARLEAFLSMHEEEFQFFPCKEGEVQVIASVVRSILGEDLGPSAELMALTRRQLLVDNDLSLPAGGMKRKSSDACTPHHRTKRTSKKKNVQ